MTKQAKRRVSISRKQIDRAADAYFGAYRAFQDLVGQKTITEEQVKLAIGTAFNCCCDAQRAYQAIVKEKP